MYICGMTTISLSRTTPKSHAIFFADTLCGRVFRGNKGFSVELNHIYWRKEGPSLVGGNPLRKVNRLKDVVPFVKDVFNQHPEWQPGKIEEILEARRREIEERAQKIEIESFLEAMQKHLSKDLVKPMALAWALAKKHSNQEAEIFAAAVNTQWDQKQ